MNSKLHKAFIVFLSVFTLLLIFPVVSVQAHIPKDTHDQFLSRNCSSFVGVTGNVAGARTASRNTSFLTRKHRIRQEATTARIGRDADKTLSGNTLNVGNKSTVDIDRITSASRKTAKRSTFTHTPGPRPQFNTDGLTEIQLAKLAKRRPDLLPQGFTPKPRALLPEASSSKMIDYSPNDPPVRIQSDWSDADIKNALKGRTPKGLGSPDLHHADQMPGSAIHEVLPSVHRGNKTLHPNKFNQGVTPKMRQQDKQLHWWYRAREQGADQKFPDLIYDNK